MAEQTYATHRRMHPLFHYIIFPILAINSLVALWTAIKHPSGGTIWAFIVALTLAALSVLVRLYALRVQDRLIRLEEQVRLRRLLPDELQSRIGDFRTSQLVAMRFCHDDELCELARAILDGEVKTTDEIKRRIRTWRADWLRV